MENRKAGTLKPVYFERYAWNQPFLTSYDHLADTTFIVVIPAFNEESLLPALKSLNACSPPNQKVAVFIIFNEAENTDNKMRQTNLRAYEEVKRCLGDFWFRVEVEHFTLPNKKAGVGLARKIGMDEAVRAFECHHKQGIIICYDADCSCDPNYFQAIEAFYRQQSGNLGLVRYAHPLDGAHQYAICQYELFLRYYIDALRYAGFPYAVQTLGSCITVRSGAYQKQGGMNTRKAGEDFYFIHKIVPLGGIGEINETCVYPSDRVSHRVPFGTGHAINKLLSAEDRPYEAYHPKIFIELQKCFESAEEIFNTGKIPSNLPSSILAFYQANGFSDDLEKILLQSNTKENFMKKFYSWWNAFRVLKFAHYARDHYYPNISLSKCTEWLFKEAWKMKKPENPEQVLHLMRKVDRETDFYIK